MVATYNAFGTRVTRDTQTFRPLGPGVTSPVVSDGVQSFDPGVGVTSGGSTAYFHSGLKNMVAQTSASGTATKEYDAFGRTRASSGTWQGPFSHAGGFGYQSGEVMNLQLLGHQYYDPETGRFLTRDPIQDGRNWFAYGAGEVGPTVIADPTGLSFEDRRLWTQIITAVLNFLIQTSNEPPFNIPEDLPDRPGYAQSSERPKKKPKPGGPRPPNGGGSGGALGAIGTIAEGSLALGEGIVVVSRYRDRI